MKQFGWRRLCVPTPAMWHVKHKTSREAVQVFLRHKDHRSCVNDMARTGQIGLQPINISIIPLTELCALKHCTARHAIARKQCRDQQLTNVPIQRPNRASI